MAYSFVGASQQQLTASAGSTVAGATAATMCAWFNRAAGSIQTVGFTESNANRFQCTPFNDNKIYSNSEGGASNSESNFTMSPNSGWVHVSLVFDGSQATNATRHVIYFNGVAQTLSFTATQPTALSAAFSTLRLGRYQSGNLWTTGDIAEFALWNAALTAGEVASIAKGFSPRRVRPQSLRLYSPMVREMQDLQGAVAWTNSNGATVSAHSRRYG